MAFCSKCGAEVAEGAQFCPKCGQPQPVGASVPPPAGYAPAAQSGLSENAAATLSYVLGWITGIIFYLIDKRPFVRFHAAQSMVTFGALHIVHWVLAMMFGVGFFMGGGHFAGWGVSFLLLRIVGLIGLVLWIICMIKAWQGERWHVPIAGDFAENLAR